MVEVHCYGRLRRLGDDPRPEAGSFRRFPLEDAPTLAALLERLGIAREELGHVFLNRRLLLTCSPMSYWLLYPDASERVCPGETPWETPLRSGDRVALFGRDMALLVV